MNRSVRMRDVANLANVATMTVSRVINGNLHVTPETRERVLQAIKTLKYRPNTVARSLREQRTRQIGIIVPNIHDPFFAVCAQAISLVARDYEYSVNIAMSDEEPNAEFDEAVLMLQRNVEGLIVIPASNAPTRLTGEEFASIPIVTLDRPLAEKRFDSVVVNNEEGAALATRHLIQHGHRKIAYLGLPLDIYTMRERHRGYCKAMQEAELEVQAHCHRWAEQDMLQTLRNLVSPASGISAIFAGNNLTTRMILHGCATLGIKVPSSIAIMGFDDFETADILNPALSVISQPIVDMGRRGAQLLFARLLGKDTSRQGHEVVLPVRLIVRHSCGAHDSALQTSDISLAS